MPNLDDVLAEHGRTLGRVIASYAPPGPEREDLAQDVAIALLRALPAFRGEASVRTYVLRVAHNQGARHAWRRRRRLRVEHEAVDVAAPAAERPDRMLASQLQAESLAALIRELPMAGRQVLTLGLEGLTHAEIAEVLGVTENVVAVRLHRARTRLRAMMEEAHE
jgi:RNA polymerase sigma factor (sigma-70 family)